MNFLKKIKESMFGHLPDTSDVKKIDSTDLAKVSRTGILMGLATMVTYLLSNLKPEMFGEHAGIAAVVIAMASEVLMRYLKDTK